MAEVFSPREKFWAIALTVIYFEIAGSMIYCWHAADRLRLEETWASMYSITGKYQPTKYECSCIETRPRNFQCTCRALAEGK